VTLTLNGVPVETRASAGSGAVAADYRTDLAAEAVGAGFRVDAADGSRMVRPGDRTTMTGGPVGVALEVVPRFRLPRFAGIDADLSLPTIMLAVTLLGTQITLLLVVLGVIVGQEGGPGMTVTPEYIARLLRGDYDGAEEGVLAHSAPRPADGDPIQSFYLQPGTPGPLTRLGGGANVGPRRQMGDPTATPSAMGAKGGGGPDPKPVFEPSADPAPGDAGEEGQEVEPQITVEVNEGWGFTDWYNTQDARQDAREIEEKLQEAHEVLRLDPDDPFGLSTRAYYEYLAMDFGAARRTYERYTSLYPERGAGWNNLALTYKRTGDYQKEEALYRIALDREPDDPTALINYAVCLAHQGRTDEALAIMRRVEVLNPGDPYAELHRAKIYAIRGDEARAYTHLQRSLASMKELDTLHDIEFRQDIRIDPAFVTMREETRFRDLLTTYYGDRPEGWWQRLGFD
jgi:Flp pilus assembly protein TadD